MAADNILDNNFRQFRMEYDKRLGQRYVAKDGSKVLSSNDFTDDYKNKLDNISSIGSSSSSINTSNKFTEQITLQGGLKTADSVSVSFGDANTFNLHNETTILSSSAHLGFSGSKTNFNRSTISAANAHITDNPTFDNKITLDGGFKVADSITSNFGKYSNINIDNYSKLHLQDNGTILADHSYVNLSHSELNLNNSELNLSSADLAFSSNSNVTGNPKFTGKPTFTSDPVFDGDPAFNGTPTFKKGFSAKGDVTIGSSSAYLVIGGSSGVITCVGIQHQTSTVEGSTSYSADDATFEHVNINRSLYFDKGYEPTLSGFLRIDGSKTTISFDYHPTLHGSPLFYRQPTFNQGVSLQGTTYIGGDNITGMPTKIICNDTPTISGNLYFDDTVTFEQVNFNQEASLQGNIIIGGSSTSITCKNSPSVKGDICFIDDVTFSGSVKASGTVDLSDANIKGLILVNGNRCSVSLDHSPTIFGSAFLDSSPTLNSGAFFKDNITIAGSSTAIICKDSPSVKGNISFIDNVAFSDSVKANDILDFDDATIKGLVHVNGNSCSISFHNSPTLFGTPFFDSKPTFNKGFNLHDITDISFENGKLKIVVGTKSYLFSPDS